MVYPFTLFLLQWLFGSALTLGGILLAPAPEITQTLFVIVLSSVVVSLLVAMRKAQHADSSRCTVLFLTAMGSLMGGQWLATQINTPIPNFVSVALSVPLVLVGTNERAIILFLGFFPVLNALADFASIGATRYFLRPGLAKRNNATLCALSDLAVGLGIFFALGCGMIWLIDTVRFADGSALLDLEGLFEDLRHNPAD